MVPPPPTGVISIILFAAALWDGLDDGLMYLLSDILPVYLVGFLPSLGNDQGFFLSRENIQESVNVSPRGVVGLEDAPY